MHTPAPPKSLFRLIAEPLLLAVVLATIVRSSIRIFSVPSGSMEPTLRIGDRIIVTPYRGSNPMGGDVIVFHSPLRRGEWMVKRVIGIPGDLVESEAGRVRVGGHTLSEPYVRSGAGVVTIAPQLVPADRYYVLGDDRATSLDSRSWGTLPRAMIAGRARVVVLSSKGRIFKWIE